MDIELLLQYAVEKIALPSGERLFHLFFRNICAQQYFIYMFWLVKFKFFRKEVENDVQPYLVKKLGEQYIEILKYLSADFKRDLSKPFLFRYLPYVLGNAGSITRTLASLTTHTLHIAWLIALCDWVWANYDCMSIVYYAFYYLCPGSRHLYSKGFRKTIVLQIVQVNCRVNCNKTLTQMISFCCRLHTAYNCATSQSEWIGWSYSQKMFKTTMRTITMIISTTSTWYNSRKRKSLWATHRTRVVVWHQEVGIILTGRKWVVTSLRHTKESESIQRECKFTATRYTQITFVCFLVPRWHCLSKIVDRLYHRYKKLFTQTSHDQCLPLIRTELCLVLIESNWQMLIQELDFYLFVRSENKMMLTTSLP